MRSVNGIAITTIETVKIANERYKLGGNSWFSRDNMRYWGCRVGNAVYGARYFVTSDRTFDDGRAYSIRELSDNGSINTVVFQAYTSRAAAHRAAKIIADHSA